MCKSKHKATRQHSQLHDALTWQRIQWGLSMMTQLLEVLQRGSATWLNGAHHGQRSCIDVVRSRGEFTHPPPRTTLAPGSHHPPLLLLPLFIHINYFIFFINICHKIHHQLILRCQQVQLESKNFQPPHCEECWTLWQTSWHTEHLRRARALTCNCVIFERRTRSLRTLLWGTLGPQRRNHKGVQFIIVSLISQQ